MAKKTPPNHGKQYTPQDIKDIRFLAAHNTPTGIIALKKGRTPTAIEDIADKENISLMPPNRSPYGTSKK